MGASKDVNLSFFFFNDPATTEIYPLPPHDALPISGILLSVTNRPIWADSPWLGALFLASGASTGAAALILLAPARGDRKSTRLNSSHSQISYAVFCLNKKKQFSRAVVVLNIDLVTA